MQDMWLMILSRFKKGLKTTAVDDHNSSKINMTNIQNWKFLAVDALKINLLIKICGFRGSGYENTSFLMWCSLVW
jgi:hypothetical protein